MNLRGLIDFVSIGAWDSQLSISVWSPSIKLSIFIHAHGIIDTTFNFHYVLELFNLLWQFNLIPVSMTQSSIFAKAPSVYFPIFSDTSSMLETTSYCSYLFIFQFSCNKVDLVIFGIVSRGVSTLTIKLKFLILFFFCEDFRLMTQFSLIRISPGNPKRLKTSHTLTIIHFK